LQAHTLRIWVTTPSILTEVLRVLPQSIHEAIRIINRIGHDSFLPYPFPFIIHQSPCLSTPPSGWYIIDKNQGTIYLFMMQLIPPSVAQTQEQIEIRECLLSFRAKSWVFLFTIQNVKIKIYRTLILHLVSYGCGTWSLTLRETSRLRAFKSRCWGGYLGLRRTRWQESGENYISSSFICTCHQVLFGWPNRE